MKIYSPKNITIRINNLLLNGFKDGQFIEFEQTEDDFKEEVSGDGEVTFVNSMNKSGKLTIGMKNNSSMGIVLFETIKRQLETLEPVSIFVKDDNIKMSTNCQGVIQKTPKYSGGKTTGEEDFVLLCERLPRDYEDKPVLTALSNLKYKENALKEKGKRLLLEAVGKMFGG